MFQRLTSEVYSSLHMHAHAPHINTYSYMNTLICAKKKKIKSEKVKVTSSRNSSKHTHKIMTHRHGNNNATHFINVF